MSIQIWKGNRLPALAATITVDGSAFDLTGSTVTFSMRPVHSGTLKVNGATATITTAASGMVGYSWQSTDVDTVGDYVGWWTYNSGGKSQDTPEFDISVVEHTQSTIPVAQPVATDGSTTIYKGDAYLASINRALVYDLTPQQMPTLSGGTVVFRVEGEFHTTATALDDSTVSVDLTSSQTAIQAGSYAFQIESYPVTGATATVLRSTLTVIDSLTSP